MINNKESMTAMVCAFGRAYHSLNENPKIFDDFLAREILGDEGYTNFCSYMAQGINFFKCENADTCMDEKSALEWVIQNQIAPTPLARSRYTEDMLYNAITLGVDQYVILGAGLDTFAFRKPTQSEKLNIFELDHPLTQEFKKMRISELGWETPVQLHFIPVDFTKDNFEFSILNSSYNPAKPSFFSMLGVTYYLTQEELSNTLASIRKVATKGSSIVFDYPDENIFNPSKTTPRVQKMVSLASASGEPMKAQYDYKTLEKLLEDAGLLIYEHLTPLDIENRYFRNRVDAYHAFENINYVLAVVD